MTKRGGIEYDKPPALGDALARAIAGAQARDRLDGWDESQHPRAPDGKFGEGEGHDAEHTYTAGKAGAEDATTGKPVDVSKDVNSGVRQDGSSDSPWEGTYSVNHGYYGSTMRDDKTGKTESWQLLPKDGPSVNVVGPRWAVELFSTGREGKQEATRIWNDRETINRAMTENLGRQGALDGARISVKYADDGKSMTIDNYDNGKPIADDVKLAALEQHEGPSGELDYNEEQHPRDEHGRWSAGGDSSGNNHYDSVRVDQPSSGMQTTAEVHAVKGNDSLVVGRVMPEHNTYPGKQDQVVGFRGQVEGPHGQGYKDVPGLHSTPGAAGKAVADAYFKQNPDAKVSRAARVETRGPSPQLEYNPDQPRDPDGKWGAGDGGGPKSSSGDTTGGPPSNPGDHTESGAHSPPSPRVEEVNATYAQSKDVTWTKDKGDQLYAEARDPQGNVVATVEDTGQGVDWTTSTKTDAPLDHGVERPSMESAQRAAEQNLDNNYTTNLRIAQEADRQEYDAAVVRATAGIDQSNVMRSDVNEGYRTTDEHGVEHPGMLTSGDSTMWKIEQRGPRWAVTMAGVTDSASWFSAASAQMHADRLNAGRMLQQVNAELAADDGPLGGAWYAVLCVDGYESADGRVFDNFDWATLPLPLMALSENQGGGHWGAVSAGTIETIEKLSDGRRVMASGHYSATETGDETQTQVESRALRFVSVDPADYDVEEEITKMTSSGYPLDARWRFTNYTIGGATICPFPAIRLAVIWNEGMDAPDELTEDLPEPVGRTDPEIIEVSDEDFMPLFMLADAEQAAKLPLEDIVLADEPEAVAILAGSLPERAAVCELTRNCGGPALPPAAWFDDPRLSGPTPLSVDAEGRVAGHVALWSTPHRGFLDYQWSDRIFAPREPDYSQFAHRPLPVACCADAGCGHARQTRKTGALVLATTHANGRLSPEQAARHYENTGYAIGDVAAGSDDYGIWVAGALRPDVDDRRVREFLGSAPSGDWRVYDGQLRLTAVLCVNSEGFPVMASSAHYEGNEVTALWRGFGHVTSELGPEALVASVHARRDAHPALGELRTMDLSEHYVTRAEFDRVVAQLAALEPLTLEQLDSLIQADA